MPSSRSSVRGLSRDIRFDLHPDETCEHMMRRIDRDTTAAVCRHLVGAVSDAGAAGAPGTVEARAVELAR